MRLWLSSVFRYFKWTQLTMRTLWILIENQYKNRLMRRGGATLHHHKPKPPMAVTLIGKEQHKRKRPRELRGGAARRTNNLHWVRFHVYRPLKWAANKVRNLKCRTSSFRVKLFAYSNIAKIWNSLWTGKNEFSTMKTSRVMRRAGD